MQTRLCVNVPYFCENEGQHLLDSDRHAFADCVSGLLCSHTTQEKVANADGLKDNNTHKHKLFFFF